MKAHTKETQAIMTPQKSLQTLKEGNKRFQQNIKSERDLQAQVSETSAGQYPFAVILSCIDSRVPAELVFDQGIGDVFSSRVAGNIINEDVLGSMEYSCKVAGSKLVVVMGHSKCGAVTAACKHVELGNITALLDKIQPAVNAVDEDMSDAKVEKVAAMNVKLSIERIRKESSILAEMEAAGEIKMVGAMYSVADGSVTFYE